MAATWSAPVRFAEVDQQGVVFNAHYLLYCDEAMGAYCEQRGLLEFASRIRLATSTLTWSGPARWGDVIDVEVECVKVGTTSATLAFELRAGGRPCCQVTTVYVNADADGAVTPIPDDVRERLLQDAVSEQPARPPG